MLHKRKRFACLREAASAKAGHAGVTFPACSIFGTVGLPPVTAGRRPTITRGLALSVSESSDSLLLSKASMVPVFLKIYNLLKAFMFWRLLLDWKILLIWQ
jgi:hypothetical protein